MGTQVRDAIVTAMIKGNGQYATIHEISDKLNLNAVSTAGALTDLLKRNAVARRRRDGSKQYEYTAGERITAAEKHIGRRLSRRKPAKAVPAAAADADVGLVIKFGGAAHSLTLVEAKTIFERLTLLFGE
jgi:predicted transcriptional regulator